MVTENTYYGTLNPYQYILISVSPLLIKVNLNQILLSVTLGIELGANNTTASTLSLNCISG